MWDRLLSRIEGDGSVKLLIQGGDQVYHDSIEEACLADLRANPPDTQRVGERIVLNYQHFFGYLPYRKILARLPSVAMLDDHDITDGWGGREEIFTTEGALNTEWAEFLRFTYDAFSAYQSIRNPAPISPGIATTYLDFGPNRLVLLDMRREKNVKLLEEPLITRGQLTDLLAEIRNTPEEIAKLFVLSPVVPVRG